LSEPHTRLRRSRSQTLALRVGEQPLVSHPSLFALVRSVELPLFRVPIGLEASDQPSTGRGQDRRREYREDRGLRVGHAAERTGSAERFSTGQLGRLDQTSLVSEWVLRGAMDGRIAVENAESHWDSYGPMIRPGCPSGAESHGEPFRTAGR
jgi:hypothetical protein